ncbi:unnamed protein product [Cuscuta europaea]|uniref:non-specific serine/threonine protein kinase n=1 Tax=Cuscuta europaea TaxID=41803 RepID=A0A9P1E1G3_CUSEU|nr:unnamed protein product [Cuscuta europaea]
MAIPIAAVAGGIGGALLLLGVIITYCFCMHHCKNSSNRNSDSASSDPPAVVEPRREGGASSSEAKARVFRLRELEHATKHFDESHLIGYGSFGMVFKGLLYDGTIVAIKRRLAAPRQQFTEEVVHMSMVHHRNLVRLLGYCQESGYQMLVFEYLPNGSMRKHLYETGMDSQSTKLEFKQRLSIASGAAKGLCHLHSQQPPILHGNFKTTNVLVDENFIAKVSGAGVSRLLETIDDAGPSHSVNRASVFRDPGVDQSTLLCEACDVYSFGVFLWELITGREASHIGGLGSNERLLQWVETHLNENDLVDRRLSRSFTMEGMGDFIKLAMRCTSFPSKQRPAMEVVVVELDKILDKEIMHTTFMGEGTTTVTLGSQLFTN